MIHLKEYILPDETIEKMVKLLEKSKMEQIEYGCIIYARMFDKNLILRNIYSGNDHCVEIAEKREYGYGEPVGDYHTHIGKELPSFFDLDFDNMGNYGEMKFVGGTNTDRIKCYIIKKIDIDFLNGISKLEQMFYDTRSKYTEKPYSKQDKKRITDEFLNIHNASMDKLIDKYFDVIEII